MGDYRRWCMGKPTFNAESGKFVFNGHGLNPGENYALIYYGKLDEEGSIIHNNEWPWATCIGQGTANDDGDVHIKGQFPFFDEFIGDKVPEKIWLVLSSDVDCENGKMTSWNPTEYLFEYNTI